MYNFPHVLLSKVLVILGFWRVVQNHALCMVHTQPLCPITVTALTFIFLIFYVPVP